jgi:hypothetical protein
MPPKMGMAPETGNGWAQRLIYSIGGPHSRCDARSSSATQVVKFISRPLVSDHVGCAVLVAKRAADPGNP